MAIARLAVLLVLSLLAASCAKKSEPSATGAGDGSWPPSDQTATAFIPDHLRGDWAVYSHMAVSESTVTEDEAVGMRGRPVTFTLDYVAFGADTCRRPTYRSAMLRADSVLATDYGASPSQFGFVGGATAIVTRTEVFCGDQRWTSPPGARARHARQPCLPALERDILPARTEVTPGGSRISPRRRPCPRSGGSWT